MSPRRPAARAQPPPGVCRHCFIHYNEIYSLESTDDRFMSCPRCGTIDEKATSAHQSINVHEIRGAQMDENEEVMTLGGAWTSKAGDAYHEWKERTFQGFLKTRLNLYLADPDRCVLETPAPHLINPVRAVFQRIREKEREHRINMAKERWRERAKMLQESGLPPEEEPSATNIRLATDSEAWRIPCQIVCAIKFVVEDRNLLYVNRRVGRRVDQFSANIQEDAEINSVPLNQIFQRLSHSNLKIKGDSLGYLQNVHRQCSELLDRTKTPMDDVLLCVLQVTKRIEFLYKLPWDQRVQAFLTKPIKTVKNKEVVLEWKKEQWSFFKHVDFEEVVPIAYELFQTQQSMKLWNGRSTAHVSVVLCLWACVASAERWLPEFLTIARELSEIFGHANSVAGGRSMEMKSLLVSFSNSFEVAGIPRPHINYARKGGIGDGFHGWGSDGRRGIPELEIAAASARMVALHWRNIVFVRKKYGYDVQDVIKERDKARPVFAKHGGREGRRIKNRYPGRPAFTKIINTLPPPPKPKQISDRPAPVEPDNTDMPQPEFVPPPEAQEPKTIEELLAMEDKSSVDESVQSSLDGEYPFETTQSTSFSRALAALDNETDYSYSIKHLLQPVDTEASVSTPAWQSTSDISPSPVLMLRQESAVSDRASISSAERVVPTLAKLGAGLTVLADPTSREVSPAMSNSRAPTTIHALSSAAEDSFDNVDQDIFIADESYSEFDIDDFTLADMQAANEYNPVHVGLLAHERPFYVSKDTTKRESKSQTPQASLGEEKRVNSLKGGNKRRCGSEADTSAVRGGSQSNSVISGAKKAKQSVKPGAASTVGTGAVKPSVGITSTPKVKKPIVQKQSKSINPPPQLDRAVSATTPTTHPTITSSSSSPMPSITAPARLQFTPTPNVSARINYAALEQALGSVENP